MASARKAVRPVPRPIPLEVKTRLQCDLIVGGVRAEPGDIVVIVCENPPEGMAANLVDELGSGIKVIVAQGSGIAVIKPDAQPQPYGYRIGHRVYAPADVGVLYEAPGHAAPA